MIINIFSNLLLVVKQLLMVMLLLKSGKRFRGVASQQKVEQL